MPLDGSSVKQGEAGEKLQSVKMLAGSSNEQWSALERGEKRKGRRDQPSEISLT